MNEHVSRRSFLKGGLVTAGGLAVANWGDLSRSPAAAADPRRTGQRCMRRRMNGGGGAGFLGPRYNPLSLDRDRRLPYFTAPYANPESSARRADLLRFMEQGFGREHHATPFEAHRTGKERAQRLLRARNVFDVKK